MRIINTTQQVEPLGPLTIKKGQRFRYDHDGKTEYGVIQRVYVSTIRVLMDDCNSVQVTKATATAWFRNA